MEHGMLQDDKVLYDVVYYHLDAIIHISQIILAFSVFIYLIRAIYLNYLKGETDYVPSFLHIGFVILAISTYKFWTVELATLIIGIARRIAPGNMSNIYKILANAYASFDELNFSVFKMNAFLNYVILSLCLFFFKLGTLVFEILQFFIQAIIWLLGPIAISMTLFPNFSGAFKKWFANFIAVNFWSVIYALLTVFFNQVMSREFSQFLEQGTADVTFEMHIIYINMLIYAVIFFISIACIPFYTGMIIPGQDVGAMSSMIAAGSMYATTRLFTVVKKIGFAALQGSKGMKTFGAKIASLKGKGKKTS